MDDILHVLAEPRRRQILELVWDRERAAGDIAAHVDVTFGAVSQHLRILREANAVTVAKRGRHRFYVANKPALGPLAAHLEATWRRQLLQLKQLAEHEEQTRG